MSDRPDKLSNAFRVRKKKAAVEASAADLSNDATVKKKRGRPPKGDRALTPAEHQRAYRERKKAEKAAGPLVFDVETLEHAPLEVVRRRKAEARVWELHDRAERLYTLMFHGTDGRTKRKWDFVAEEVRAIANALASLESVLSDAFMDYSGRPRPKRKRNAGFPPEFPGGEG